MSFERKVDGKSLELHRQKLLEAAEWLRTHEHYKGAYLHYESFFDVVPSGACAIGAIMLVSGETSHEFLGKALKDYPITGQAHELMWGVLRVQSPITFNDQPETTKEQVISMMEAAAFHGLGDAGS